MPTMELPVWDGTRERSPRTMLSTITTSAQGIDFRFVSEQVTTPTDWCFEEDHHVVVVHRGGRLRSMEIEFERGPSGPHTPRVGDIWVIPAEHRYAALAQGRVVQFCELTIPTATLADRDLTARTNHRDPLVHRLIERMSTVADRRDVTARLLIEALAETVRLHLVDQFGGGAVRRSRRRRFDRLTRARLMEYLEYSFDTEISLAALAKLADMTVSEFSATFTADFGSTPYQFVLDRRIHRAKELLATTTMSITDIGMSVGFSTPSHFATTFKNRVGMPPSIYRRNA
ncbi:helix-turn-helix transcriptional regulator [Mycolicibacterium goodii]|uniref:helix-turn-helix transcriptional regulator n=1 Tax=Mycolicibacterium goodii TaxID=134601 RepID=UPI001BDC9224|nr:helix-turn-helix transcriptional regulator [Mycolicibacterium goodii]MBU8828934.1 helix-turn-helix transcriptional regulator [Mycolicibacterium goodii]